MDRYAHAFVWTLVLGAFVSLGVEIRAVEKSRIEEARRLSDELFECVQEEEALRLEYETCQEDTELLERSLDHCSEELEHCSEWYAQREYAADADY